MIKIYADMVGDLFHKGHVEMLKSARNYGDYLIVGVLSDDVVLSYKRKPVMNMEERISVIQACKYVDEVIPNAPNIITSEFLKKYNISYVIHGDNISQEEINNVYKIPFEEGKLKLIKTIPDISTTEIINRVLSGNHSKIEKL